MRTAKRVAVITGTIVIVGIGALAARIMIMAGVFDTVTPIPRSCKTLTDVTGTIAIPTRSHRTALMVDALVA